MDDSDITTARNANGQFRKGFPHNRGRKHTPEHVEKNRAARTGVKQSPETVAKRIMRGERHGNWKGDDVGYSALHIWVKRNYGPADRCDNPSCERINVVWFDWANVSGEYRRDREDWLRLCRSCHRKRDVRVRGVLQFSLEGVLVNIFKSAQEAADSLGIRTANITAVCAGRQKKSYGYKWKWLQP